MCRTSYKKLHQNHKKTEVTKKQRTQRLTIAYKYTTEGTDGLSLLLAASLSEMAILEREAEEERRKEEKAEEKAEKEKQKEEKKRKEKLLIAKSKIANERGEISQRVMKNGFGAAIVMPMESAGNV